MVSGPWSFAFSMSAFQLFSVSAFALVISAFVLCSTRTATGDEGEDAG
jgi:hypothetical protein